LPRRRDPRCCCSEGGRESKPPRFIINLEQISSHADRIFYGRCVEIQVGTDAPLGQNVRYATFAPRRLVKGRASGRITIKLLGNQEAWSRRVP
jgi:hypothetical protein